MKYLPRIFPYVRPYWAIALGSVFIMILSALAALLTPWPLKILVDYILGPHLMPPWLAWLFKALGSNRISLMISVILGGFAIALLDGALGVLGSYLHTKIEQWMILDFRSDLFQHSQRLSLAFHDQRRSGLLIYIINFQGDAAARVLMTILPIAQSAITLIGMFWITYRMDYRLALVSLIIVPFLYYSVNYYATHIQKRILDVRGMEGESLSIIHEAISMLRVIIAFGRENHEYGRFRDQGERTVTARVKLTVRETFFSLAVNMITAIGTALVLGFGAYQVILFKLSIGDLLVVLAYIAAVYKPLETISYTVGSIQESMAALSMAFSLLDTPPEIHDLPGAVPVPALEGRVQFENVSFAYKGRNETLKNISFEAPPGAVVAVVGATGAGKSTLVSLIPRFYDLQQGRVLLDGRDINQITLKSLRQNISIVLQEPLLFSGTIADNIRYGRLEAGIQEVIAAAQAANAHDFITELPDHYDTVTGERGAKLSGGERQRIAVARAFLKDAPILILDEPTSSIDSKTEVVILDALDRLMLGRTTFIIAHRLSTIRRADLILVMDRGELVECGTHQALLERGGFYAQMHEIQLTQGRGEPQWPTPDVMEAVNQDGE